MKVHFIDTKWIMKCVVLELLLFHAQNTGLAFESVILSVIKKCHLFETQWGFECKLRAVTTDNTSDVDLGMSWLLSRLFNRKTLLIDDFHVSYLAHVKNLTMKACLA